MNNRTLFFTLSAVGIAIGTMPLSGCSYWKAHQAKEAYGEYQQALAAGDLLQARNALTKLVRTDQDVSDYWLELGKLQLEIGDYRGAYDAFAHAHELDRSNVEVLSIMAQMALLSNDLDTANDHARSLALVAPDSSIVTMIRGYVALRSGELDKAAAAADLVIAAAPQDPFGKILKARVLVANSDIDGATTLLEEQHRVAPKDRRTLRALAELYRSRADWRNLGRIQSDAHALDPKDTAIALSAVEAWLRAGNIPAASLSSEPMLAASADTRLLDQALGLWVRFGPRAAALPNVDVLAKASTGQRRVAFANYFNGAGEPASATKLLQASQLPVTHANARWNAVLAQSWALQGREQDARQLFDLVLDQEADQVEALRGRSALKAKSGDTRQALVDAQRLVTVNPSSGEDRLILARAFLAARNGNGVRRTLWQAFQDLPQDERVFSALRNVLVSAGDVDGQRRLEDEYRDRRGEKLLKDIV